MVLVWETGAVTAHSSSVIEHRCVFDVFILCAFEFKLM